MSACYLSTGAFRTRSLDEIVFLCLRYDLRRIELSSGLDPFDMGQVAHRLEQLAPCLVHNYFPPPDPPIVLNLAAEDRSSLEASLALCRRAIDLSAAFGAPFYSVHSGFVAALTPDMLGNPDAQAAAAATLTADAYERAFDRFCESASTLSRYARAAGVRLLFENNVQTRETAGRNHLLMVRAEEFERFFARLNDSNIGVLVDTGHLRVSARTLGFSESEFCLRLAHRIHAFHLSENDGLADQNRPVTAASWFWPVVRLFPKATVVLEAYGLSISQMLHQRDLVDQHLSPVTNQPHAIHF
ncbi:MAG: TIM barrel protein [Rhodothermales bacterium]